MKMSKTDRGRGAGGWGGRDYSRTLHRNENHCHPVEIFESVAMKKKNVFLWLVVEIQTICFFFFLNFISFHYGPWDVMNWVFILREKQTQHLKQGNWYFDCPSLCLLFVWLSPNLTKDLLKPVQCSRLASVQFRLTITEMWTMCCRRPAAVKISDDFW